MKSHPSADPPAKRSGFLSTGVLFGASLLAALILGEIVVRMAIPVRNIGPTFSEYDPVYGKRLKKSFSCTRIAAEFTMQFSTNSLGFRGPEPPEFPTEGVLFLGDSFTSGYGVNDGEEFPAVIRKALEHRWGKLAPPVVNAGSGNIGNGYWLRFLQRETSRYKPQMVVLGFSGNDFADNVVEGLYRLGSDGKVQASGKNPPQEGARSVQAVIEAVPGLSYSYLIGLARQFFSEGWGAGPEPPPTEANEALTYALVDSILSYCSAQHLPALLLVIEVEDRQAVKLRRVASHYDVPCVEPPTKWVRPEWSYHYDWHWNAGGHANVANMLLPYVEHLVFPKNVKG